jgi:Tol biopolymer transport system component
MWLVLFVSLAAHAFAAEEVAYTTFHDGEFQVDHPDWKQKKPGSEIQVLRLTKGSCSILVDVYPAGIERTYDTLRSQLEKSENLLHADPENYVLEYKASFLLLKVRLKTKLVSANNRTYAVSFAGVGGEYRKRLPVGEHVLNSARSSGGLSSQRAEGPKGPEPRRDGFRYGIYGVKNDGSELKRLYASHLPIRGPEGSPDGKKIVFYLYAKDTNGDGLIYDNDFASSEIAVVNLDGTGFEVLTENLYWDLQPNWSHDGKRIIFVSNRESSAAFELDLFVMNPATRTVKNITNTKDATEADPDCQAGKIVATRFFRNKDSQSIWIMDEDGSNQKCITFPEKSGRSKTGYLFGDFDPSLTHDGNRVAFTRLEDDRFKIDGNVVGNYEVYVMNSDGSNPTNISRTVFLEGVPEWSPDGKEIAYIVVDQEIRDRYRVYVTDEKGKNKRKIIQDAPIDFLMRDCSWFPNTPGEHPDMIFVGEWFE